jgi:hypothetical protein
MYLSLLSVFLAGNSAFQNVGAGFETRPYFCTHQSSSALPAQICSIFR